MTRSYPDQLERIHVITGSLARRAIDDLPIRAGARGLDAGCGVGNHAPWLLLRAAPGGHVTGLDRSTETLAAARRSDPAQRVAWVQGDA